jgi:hypothetical protein
MKNCELANKFIGSGRHGFRGGEDGFSLAPEVARDYLARMARNGSDTGEGSLAEPAKPEVAEVGLWAGHPERFCPNCSAQLTENRCKLSCLRCGYYLSCSDFY